MSNSAFGLAEVKKEGQTMWPHTFLMLNGCFPPKSIYTALELEEQKKQGYTEEDYAPAE